MEGPGLTAVLLMLSVAGQMVAVKGEDVCQLRPETGMCRGHMPRFYYDSSAGTCKRFIYGGCGGNGNKFESASACMNACSKGDVCQLPAEPGMCRAYIPSFHYDAATGTCKRFVYGGCGGNGNRFASADECQARCTPKSVCGEPAETGMCRGFQPSYAYNVNTGECERFIYGGCGGNGNRFGTKRACESVCKQS